MRFVIFGLTLSSSWGNGHATLWRGLIRALARRRHTVTFFERDVPYYATHRDLTTLPGTEIILYRDWRSVLHLARQRAAHADATIITSYCPDAIPATHVAFDDAPNALHVFYDLDTPVTLARIDAGETVEYLPAEGLQDFDLVLSFTGGMALETLQRQLKARHVAPLYGHVDPDVHRPTAPDSRYSADLSYLGTYAQDRQDLLDRLFVEPARRHPGKRFMLGGSQYPADFPWTANIWYVSHVPPPEHPAFFSSSRLTLNITRRSMAAIGYCPSGRLFEAAACGAPLLSDTWEGLEHFFTPEREILTVRNADEVSHALELTPSELTRIAQAARERVLDEHHSGRRAEELLRLLDSAPGKAWQFPASHGASENAELRHPAD